jgi:8-oxo-dGTP pyrophosphatase MutT (NUDIX family)
VRVSIEGDALVIQRSRRLRQLVYSLWGMLPRRLQHLLIYLGAPKVTLGVSAVILDPQGRVLLVHHTYSADAWAWDFPGGLVGRHEQPAAALARELREELALTATVGAIVYAVLATGNHHLTLYYHVTIAGTPRHESETDAHRYVSVHEAQELLGTARAAWLRIHPLFQATDRRP